MGEFGIPMNFSEWVKNSRKSCMISQETLADYVGCSTSAIQKYESGERTPTPATFGKIKEVFEKINGGLTTIEKMEKLLDNAVIDGASGDDEGIMEFFRFFDSEFDKLNHINGWYNVDDFDWFPQIESAEVAGLVNDLFFDGEEFFRCDERYCKDPVRAAMKWYSKAKYQLWNVECSGLDEFWNEDKILILKKAFRTALFGIWVSLKKCYVHEQNPDKVVGFIYKAFCAMRKEMLAGLNLAKVCVTEIDGEHSVYGGEVPFHFDVMNAGGGCTFFIAAAMEEAVMNKAQTIDKGAKEFTEWNEQAKAAFEKVNLPELKKHLL